MTHDQEEGLEVADPVVVMNRGRIEQIGTPDEADSSPASPIIFQFLGSVNVVHRRLHGAWAEVGGAHGDAAADAEATAVVRPHDFDIERHPLPGSLQADVQEVHAIGPLVRVELAHASELIEVELTRERAAVLALARGRQVWFKPRQVRVFATPATTLEERGSGI